MAELRVYFKDDSARFFDRMPIGNHQPGHPGTHHADFNIEQFMPVPPFTGWDLLENISDNYRTMGASIKIHTGGNWDCNIPDNACVTDGNITIMDNGTHRTIWGKNPCEVLRMYLHLMKIEIKPLPAECDGYNEHQPLPEKEMYPHEFAVMLILGMIPAGIMSAGGHRFLAAITWVAVVLVGCSLIHYLNGNGFRPLTKSAIARGKQFFLKHVRRAG